MLRIGPVISKRTDPPRQPPVIMSSLSLFSPGRGIRAATGPHTGQRERVGRLAQWRGRFHSYTLSILRRNIPDRGRKPRMCCRFHWLVNHFGAGWIVAQKVVAFPVPRRPDGPRNKTPPAVWTDVAQDLLDAGGAEGAFIAADARIERIGRQGLVALLACGSECEHDPLRV